MSEVTELMENMEHAGHGGGHGDHGGGKKSIAKYVGITMAVLGVLLALCSAMVGGTRTELIASMVQRTNVAMKYQAVSTKFRMLQANLLQMNALLPSDPDKFKQLESALVDAQSKLPASSDAANTTTVIRNFHDQLMMTVIPTTGDLKHFVELARGYKAEAKAALAWEESYEDAIEAHEKGGEHYEWAMLCAEIGIVIASIALLLSSRPAWMLSLGLGIAAIIVLVTTNISVRATLKHAEAEITEGEENYNKAASEEKAEKSDEALFKSIEAMP